VDVHPANDRGPTSKEKKPDSRVIFIGREKCSRVMGSVGNRDIVILSPAWVFVGAEKKKNKNKRGQRGLGR